MEDELTQGRKKLRAALLWMWEKRQWGFRAMGYKIGSDKIIHESIRL
jgi:hypothetical protein